MFPKYKASLGYKSVEIVRITVIFTEIWLCFLEKNATRNCVPVYMYVFHFPLLCKWYETTFSVCDISAFYEQVPLCLIKHHALKSRRCGGIASRFLNIGTWWGRVVSFTPRRHPPRERHLGTLWIWDWVGPKSQSGRCVEEKKFVSLPGIESDSLVGQLIYRRSYPCSSQ
jgi:hypothetical protein